MTMVDDAVTAAAAPHNWHNNNGRVYHWKHGWIPLDHESASEALPIDHSAAIHEAMQRPNGRFTARSKIRFKSPKTGRLVDGTVEGDQMGSDRYIVRDKENSTLEHGPIAPDDIVGGNPKTRHPLPPGAGRTAVGKRREARGVAAAGWTDKAHPRDTRGRFRKLDAIMSDLSGAVDANAGGSYTSTHRDLGSAQQAIRNGDRGKARTELDKVAQSTPDPKVRALVAEAQDRLKPVKVGKGTGEAQPGYGSVTHPVSHPDHGDIGTIHKHIRSTPISAPGSQIAHGYSNSTVYTAVPKGESRYNPPRDGKSQVREFRTRSQAAHHLAEVADAKAAESVPADATPDTSADPTDPARFGDRKGRLASEFDGVAVRQANDAADHLVANGFTESKGGGGVRVLTSPDGNTQIRVQKSGTVDRLTKGPDGRFKGNGGYLAGTNYDSSGPQIAHHLVPEVPAEAATPDVGGADRSGQWVETPHGTGQVTSSYTDPEGDTFHTVKYSGGKGQQPTKQAVHEQDVRPLGTPAPAAPAAPATITNQPDRPVDVRAATQQHDTPTLRRMVQDGNFRPQDRAVAQAELDRRDAGAPEGGGGAYRPTTAVAQPASSDPAEIDSLASDGTSNAMDLGFDADTPEGQSANAVFEAISGTQGNSQAKIDAGVAAARQEAINNPQGRDGSLAVLRSVLHSDTTPAEALVPASDSSGAPDAGAPTPDIGSPEMHDAAQENLVRGDGEWGVTGDRTMEGYADGGSAIVSQNDDGSYTATITAVGPDGEQTSTATKTYPADYSWHDAISSANSDIGSQWEQADAAGWSDASPSPGVPDSGGGLDDYGLPADQNNNQLAPGSWPKLPDNHAEIADDLRQRYSATGPNHDRGITDDLNRYYNMERNGRHDEAAMWLRSADQQARAKGWEPGGTDRPDLGPSPDAPTPVPDRPGGTGAGRRLAQPGERLKSRDWNWLEPGNKGVQVSGPHHSKATVARADGSIAHWSKDPGNVAPVWTLEKVDPPTGAPVAPPTPDATGSPADLERKYGVPGPGGVPNGDLSGPEPTMRELPAGQPVVYRSASGDLRMGRVAGPDGTDVSIRNTDGQYETQSLDRVRRVTMGDYQRDSGLSPDEIASDAPDGPMQATKPTRTVQRASATDPSRDTWGDTPWSKIPADYRSTGPNGERRVLARTPEGGTVSVPWHGATHQPDNAPEIGSPPVGPSAPGERQALRDRVDAVRSPSGRSAKMQRAFQAANEGDHAWLASHAFDAQPGDQIHVSDTSNRIVTVKPDGRRIVHEVNGNGYGRRPNEWGGGGGPGGTELHRNTDLVRAGFRPVHDPGAAGVPSDVGGEAERQALRDRVAKANGGRSAKMQRAFTAAEQGDHAWLAQHGFDAHPGDTIHHDGKQHIALGKPDGSYSVHEVNGNGQASKRGVQIDPSVGGLPPAFRQVGPSATGRDRLTDTPGRIQKLTGPGSASDPGRFTPPVGADVQGAEANRTGGTATAAPAAPAVDMSPSAVRDRVNAALRDSGNHEGNQVYVDAGNLDAERLRDGLRWPGDTVTVKPASGYETQISRADAEALLRAQGGRPPGPGEMVKQEHTEDGYYIDDVPGQGVTVQHPDTAPRFFDNRAQADQWIAQHRSVGNRGTIAPSTLPDGTKVYVDDWVNTPDGERQVVHIAPNGALQVRTPTGRTWVRPGEDRVTFSRSGAPKA